MSHFDNFNEFFDSVDMQTLHDLFVILPENESSNGNQAAFGSDVFSSIQNHGFSPSIESMAQPTEPMWQSENMQPATTAVWQQIDMQATTMASQPSDMQPRTVAAEQVSSRQSATVQAPQQIYSSDESQGSETPLVTTVESNLGNPVSILESYVCGICGDRATGKHYGAISCDGCKGFFRRSVRKFHQYVCRYTRSCAVTKEKRNQCRFCRLRKCFAAGMKKDAVQNERDKINYRRSSPKQNRDATRELPISNLFLAEERDQTVETTIAAEHAASTEDVHNSIKNELLRFVDWANKLPEFQALNLQDQEKLLKNKGAELLILGVAKRSFNRHDSLLLGNRSIISKDILNTDSIQSDDSQPMVQKGMTVISNRIFRELIQPWKRINMDNVEFACLKMIVFFDPNAKELTDPEKIEAYRNEVQIHLENHINNRQYEGTGRLGKLLLTLPSLQSISKEMATHILYAQFVYGLQIDGILQEML